MNLSERPLSGGYPQIRKKPDGPISTYRYGAPGDALIFRISPSLVHPGTPVTGAMPKDIFAAFVQDRPTAGTGDDFLCQRLKPTPGGPSKRTRRA
ncbi:MAG: hypothetical protein ACHQ2Z_07135 [Elusimicrobiota bacterium]